MTTTEFLVRKNQLQQTRVRNSVDVPLQSGQVRLQVGRFALTSNNITYAAFGDAMHYWDFYPSGEPDWGIIPVWGFASVVQSLHPGVAVGERLYGYFPMASHGVLLPTRLSEAGFTDGSEHRTALPAVYNQVLRCATDPFRIAQGADLQALLQPLFVTSWLIDDFMADNDFFGAVSAGAKPVMLLSSASSKTAYGTAFMLAQRNGVEVVGLTSPGNVKFCESLGCYHRVVCYDQLEQVDANAPCVYVDFAGNGALREAVHSRFANLRYSCSIGGTHVDQLRGGRNLPGPKPTLFFAPTQIAKRRADWGGAEYGRRVVQAWQSFVARVRDPQSPWLTVHEHRGVAAVTSAYSLVLAGRGDARSGHMLSLQE